MTSRSMTDKALVVSAGLWLGLVLTVGGVVAPSLFASLERGLAGRAAGAVFAWEAQIGLALGALILVFERLRVRARTASTVNAPSQFTVVFGLALAAIALTVLSHFVLQPMMGPARQGLGPLSFGTLHGISSAMFLIKAVVLAALLWRCA